MTPPEGLQLKETYIPGDTIVQIPTYTLHRGETKLRHILMKFPLTTRQTSVLLLDRMNSFLIGGRLSLN